MEQTYMYELITNGSWHYFDKNKNFQGTPIPLDAQFQWLKELKNVIQVSTAKKDFVECIKSFWTRKKLISIKFSLEKHYLKITVIAKVELNEKDKNNIKKSLIEELKDGWGKRFVQSPIYIDRTIDKNELINEYEIYNEAKGEIIIHRFYAKQNVEIYVSWYGEYCYIDWIN